MGTLWETLREFASTLSTLARAQSVLVLIISSWVFTGVWVFATERKRHDPPRRGRALLGLFWFPGLFLYYAFPGEATAHESEASTFTYEHTPKTVEAPRGWRRSRDEEVTSDGLGPTPAAARSSRRRELEATDDGTSLASAPPPPSPRRRASRTTAFSLEVLSGSRKGERLSPPSGKREIYMGRRHNNDIQLADPSVADWHVVISYEESGQWVLRVVEHAVARYETEVDGRLVKVKPLDHGSEIRLGEVRLRFHRG
jgi:hypothetical protein